MQHIGFDVAMQHPLLVYTIQGLQHALTLTESKAPLWSSTSHKLTGNNSRANIASLVAFYSITALGPVTFPDAMPSVWVQSCLAVLVDALRADTDPVLVAVFGKHHSSHQAL